MKRPIDIEPVKQRWNDLSFKERMSYIFAMVCFTLGWLVTFVGFFLPPMGQVHETILWILGQALLFTGAVIGIGQYYNSQVSNFKRDIMNYIRDDRMEHIHDDRMEHEREFA